MGFINQNINNIYDTAYMEEIPLAKGEVALWRAVITQALIDCGSLSKRTEDMIAKKDALEWLTYSNKDFFKVCSLAQMEPHYVTSMAKEAIKNGVKWRNDTQKEKRILKQKNILPVNWEAETKKY